MKTIKVLLAAMLLSFSASALAQATYEAADGTKYEFQKHAFLNLEGGAQYTLGEAKFSKLISPNVQLGLGYQFSPVFGARIQANAWQSKGGWNGFRPTIGAAPYTNDYKYKYVAPGIDLMFNLSNLFCGWNPNRVFNLSAFLGGGANIAFDNDEANDIAKNLASLNAYNLDYVWTDSKISPFGRGGLEAAFKLSDAVALTIEGNANILGDKYNSKKAERKLKADWYFNALVGLKINLGKAYNKILPPPPAPAPAPEPVVEPEPIVEQPAPAPVVEKIEPLRRDIFFEINKTVIRDGEQQKVKDVADYLAKYPNAKVQVTGYADAGTGNDKINDRLAAGRADAVVKALKEQYGIAESRISYDSKGSRVQPFAENDLNRVSICIAE
ncbi:MAG: OmpA family protein [Prevotella sp.]|nr:OmpA family protein [Prevotella sp.]MBR5748548.1 OmpA family protein [Prevotella sp.]